MGEMIQFNCPGGGSAPGYLAKPASGDGPGIVVIQEWWGMNDQIKKVGDRFAAEGYCALVPDLYRGRVTQDPDDHQWALEGLELLKNDVGSRIADLG